MPEVKYAPISDLLETIIDYRGKTPPKSPEGIPTLTAANVKNGRIDLSKVSYVSKETYERWTTRGFPKARDVMITTEAPVGEVAPFPGDQTYLMTRRVIAMRGKEGILHNDFLLYVLLSSKFKNRLLEKARGSTVPRVLKTDITELEIPVPDFEIQKKISRVFASIDEKIELNRQTNQTLETIAQAIFKSWFVDFEPVKAKMAALETGGTTEEAELAAMCAISGKDQATLARLQKKDPEAYQKLTETAGLFPSVMQDSELGEIPKGWQNRALYDTAEYVNGAVFKAQDFSAYNNGFPIIKIAELKQGVSAGTKFTEKKVPDKYFLKNDDVLYSWSGSPETSLEVFKWFGGNGWLNQHIFKLNFESNEQKYFTYFLLRQIKPLLIATAKQKQTTGLGHVTVADMKRIKQPYPNKELLICFAEKVGSIYEMCSVSDKEISNLAKIREALLPKLLSEEIDPNRLKNNQPKNATSPAEAESC
ncbi:restriction endonuclease subunit S [Exilibacterium tricleocarpae]|uniref:restriction endonuclease subunit S n=1 Tax=Exilibacterium tricleocarpae TaxID=2591008 RepID=UPI0015D120EF|nr:restriction endonuclease subunit S [Exilibacterium tricleocarpae]